MINLLPIAHSRGIDSLHCGKAGGAEANPVHNTPGLWPGCDHPVQARET
jgi:hypothetical protein